MTAAVLLIDLENMVGAKAKLPSLTAKLDALTSKAPGVPAVAACGAGRVTKPGIAALDQRGIRLIRTDSTRDAADHALIDEARRLAASGCSKFLVASHDRAFAALADLGTLEIIAWQTPKLADVLTSRATQVHLLPRPRLSAAPAAASAARPAAPAKAAAKQKTTAAQTTAAKASPAAAARPAPVSPAPPAQAPPPAFPALRIRPVHVAAAAVGVTAAGLIFGAGSVLGAAAAVRLLHRVQLLPGQPTGSD